MTKVIPGSYTQRQGERIRAVRERKGMSQAEVARALRMAPPILSRVENGYSCPTTRWLARLAAVLGVPTSALLPTDDD